MAKLVNKSDRKVGFSIAGLPGEPAKRFEVAPGECCEVPDGYCQEVNGRCIIKMLAPGLEPYVESPEQASPPPVKEVGEPSAPPKKKRRGRPPKKRSE